MLRCTRPYTAWVIDAETGIAHSTICKAGSTSIALTISHTQRVDSCSVGGIATRVAWIRHPLRRLESGYQFFRMNENAGIKNHLFIPTNSWEAYVDYTLKVGNRHWNPQHKSLSCHGEYMPTVTHRFEDIGELWNLYSEYPLKHVNKSTRPATSWAWDYRLDELVEKYTHDQLLWDSLCS